tara:strand:- start:2361 stop:2552 length:192 start_codon:yes stop_codon:yes gene_type:complete
MSDLIDVSEISFFERQRHYLDTYGGDTIDGIVGALPFANTAATAEMLDEIHTMLRHLCAISEK